MLYEVITLWNLSQIETGLDPRQVALATVNLPDNRYPEGNESRLNDLWKFDGTDWTWSYNFV